jgi:hypothetical protein
MSHPTDHVPARGSLHMYHYTSRLCLIFQLTAHMRLSTCVSVYILDLAKYDTTPVR